MKARSGKKIICSVIETKVKCISRYIYYCYLSEINNIDIMNPRLAQKLSV